MLESVNLARKLYEAYGDWLEWSVVDIAKGKTIPDAMKSWAALDIVTKQRWVRRALKLQREEMEY